MRDFFKVWSEDNMNQEFIEGYCDGHGQAIENVRYNLLKYLVLCQDLVQIKMRSSAC